MNSPLGNLSAKGVKKYRLGRIRQVAFWISGAVTSGRSEASNVSLVILDKFQFVNLKPLF